MILIGATSKAVSVGGLFHFRPRVIDPSSASADPNAGLSARGVNRRSTCRFSAAGRSFELKDPAAPRRGQVREKAAQDRRRAARWDHAMIRRYFRHEISVDEALKRGWRRWGFFSLRKRGSPR